MATQVKGIVTREMIDRGVGCKDACPVAEALKIGVLNLYAAVEVRAEQSGGGIFVYGKEAVRDEEFHKVRAWVHKYDFHLTFRRTDLVEPITFTLTFEGEFS